MGRFQRIARPGCAFGARALAAAATVALAASVLSAPINAAAQSTSGEETLGAVGGGETQTWRRYRVSFATAGAALPGLLRDLASAAGVRLELDPAVSGEVVYTAEEARLDVVLTELGARHAFSWWHDGAALRIAPSSRNVSRILRLTRVAPETLRETLSQLSLYEPRFPIREGARGLTFVSGPPEYVAAIELVLADLEAAAAERAQPRSIQIIRWGRVGNQVVPGE